MIAARSKGDRCREATFTLHAAFLYRGLRDLPKARSLCKRALEIAPAKNAHLRARAHYGFGLIADDQGRLQEALTEYRLAQELWHEAEDRAEEARTLSNLGHILLMTGQTNEALAVFTQALPLLDRKNPKRLPILDGVGQAHHLLGARKQALLMYQLALRLAKTPEAEARMLSRIGTLYRDEGDLDRASQELDKARRIAHNLGNRRWEAFTLADLAHVDDLRGRDEDAVQTFDKAFKMLEGLPEPLTRASVLFGRAEALRDLGRLEEAVKSIERSVSFVEPVRADLVDPRERVFFYSLRQRYYELYVTLLMDRHWREQTRGWEVRAFEASDRSRSRSLLDDIAGEATTKGSKLVDIQRELLDSETTLLAYALGDRGSFLWVVNRGRIDSFKLPTRFVVEEAAAEVRSRLLKNSSGLEIKSLSRMLLPDRIEPLLRTRLLISADGVLHAIPFSLLRKKSGQQLIFDHVVSSLPSASYLVGMRRRFSSRPSAPKSIAILADAVFERDDPRLIQLGVIPPESPDGVPEPYRLILSGLEADRILRFFPKSGSFKAVGFEASRSTALSQALADYQRVHITTHHIEGDHPEFSGLMLSRYDRRGRPQEGLLRASEIYELKFPAELVVLSACGSGLGQRVRGEGPMGMTRAFLHAGAKRVVVSLWAVEDDATAELMSRFYRAMLKDRLPPSDALGSAQRSMARDPRWRSSGAWAAFVLQGEPR